MEKKSDFKTQIGAEVLYNPEDKKVRTDADVRLMTKDSVYTLGLSNVGKWIEFRCDVWKASPR